MSNFDRPGATIDTPTTRRSAASRFGDLGERLARTFGGFERTATELPPWEGEALEFPASQDTEAFFPTEERFPMVRHGYDPVAVDQQFDEVEREMAELRERKPSTNAITREIDRIGEQTAAILQTAYQQAAEITREAREQADKCLADAAANAVSITEEANRRLRELDAETDAVWQERTRLIEDARRVAGTMLSLADGALERFPAEAVQPMEGIQPPESPQAYEPVAPVRASQPEALGTPFDSEDAGGQVPPRGDA